MRDAIQVLKLQFYGLLLLTSLWGLQNVLNQGFDVDYRNDRSITCLRCEASGGICGFHSSSHPFVCFCHDGEQPLVRSSNEHSRSMNTRLIADFNFS
ncbi:leaf rust 10 disease-resistance locus receptor-like protein kinase-like 2.1 [Quercus suber]|uniref:Leaf rust 10 disease-resistance locus receptor-like protein kinase-like 2.1 n=1 Tax=Quercus suber TaxID=58331 RepID=A0AAW0L013_QUESU